MSIKEKIGYIIEYYGFMILALLLMILVGFFLIHGLFEDGNDGEISVVAVNQNYTEDTIRIWESDFDEAYGTTSVEFEPYYKIKLEGFASDTEQGYLMKLSANLFAGEIDVMVLDKKSFDHFSGLGALTDLSSVVQEILHDEGYDDMGKNSLLSAGPENQVETFGLELPSILQQESGDGSYLVIPSSSSQKESYQELIRTLYEP